MRIRAYPIVLTKRCPLTISRGTSTGTVNLIVEVEHNGVVGLGEMAPFNIGYGQQDVESGLADIDRWAAELEGVSPFEMQRVEAIVDVTGGESGTRAALIAAMYDWVGKLLGIPVWQLLGCDRERIPFTSITVGINTPDWVRERVPELMARLAPRALKVKLGGPAGIESDQEMFEAVQEVTPRGVSLRVDANGGWNLTGARRMIPWLSKRGVEFVEQPLPVGHDQDSHDLYAESPLPIFADESCRFASDVPRLADRVHGVNLKLMKAGGIREGLRLIHTARAHGLKVMIGCMSESSLAIAVSAAISSYADFLDLDSHQNLLPDPFSGLSWSRGRVLPSDAPGLGVRTTES